MECRIPTESELRDYVAHSFVESVGKPGVNF